ncbi:MAG: adenylyltransferase/cytidyltransferase family protein, partial [Candidatus Eiseniibacteriota bacterium]
MSAFTLPPEAAAVISKWRAAGERIVFTNGVFDLLHRGHAEYLEEARALGARLVVG